MNKIIVLGYILITTIVFFIFFCCIITYFKREKPNVKFTTWYFDNKWFLLNIICSVLCYITIPVGLIVWCFTKVCKVIMKIYKVE